jgi:hypothetical protein
MLLRTEDKGRAAKDRKKEKSMKSAFGSPSWIDCYAFRHAIGMRLSYLDDSRSHRLSTTFCGVLRPLSELSRAQQPQSPRSILGA